MTYCQESDLLLGDLATSSVQAPQRFVQDASDEIDQALGVRYVTPINIALLSNPAKLTLKRINLYLATGGFMVNAAKGEKNLHATGMMYMKMARDSLQMILSGDYILQGAVPNPDFVGTGTGAAIANVDDISYVENYYVNGNRTQPIGFGESYPPMVERYFAG